MEIIFGQYLDEGYWIDRSQPQYKNLFNTEITGPMGLLCILERELGLTGIYKPASERRVIYKDIIRKYLDVQGKTIFSQSFEIDPGGVASELLSRRDQLILAGWNGDYGTISPAVDFLTAVEKISHVPPGIEDRWRRLFNELDKCPAGCLYIDKISHVEPLTDLHPFFSFLFSALMKAGVNIEKYAEEALPEADGNLSDVQKLISGKISKCSLESGMNDFQVIRFRDHTEAATFFASQDALLKEAVIISADATYFDQVMTTFGKPASGSTFRNANPPVIQLLKLSTALFVQPLNIHNLLSYLHIPVHPVPQGLRNRLMEIIASKGGVENDEWAASIEDFVYKDEKTKKEDRLFITISDNQHGKNDKNTVIQYYKSLQAWARRIRMASKDESHPEASQLLHLQDLCNTLIIALEQIASDDVTDNELLQAVKDVYEPMNITNYKAQRYSVPMVSLPGQILNPPKTVIWMDFFNSEIKPHFYTFLNEEEGEKLTRLGALICNSGTQTKMHLDMLRKGILNARSRCVLAVCDTYRGKPTGEHPVLALLTAGINDIKEHIIDFEDIKLKRDFPKYGFTTPEYVRIEKSILPVKQSEVKIDSGKLIRNRDTESYSSIDLLIQYPFDWVMQYAARIKPATSYALGDTAKACGDVAHRYIERLFNEAALDHVRAKERLKDFDLMITDTIKSYGALLLLPENRFELERFKSCLKKSTENLITIIQENGLKLEGIEFPVTGSAGILDGQEFYGSVDILLSDCNDSRIIFDLKWTKSQKKYRNKIIEGKAIQLALYKALIERTEKKQITATAYFMLADGMLLTSAPLKGKCVKKLSPAESDENLLKRIEGSVMFRKAQFSKNIIEEGEGMPLEVLEYHNASEQERLIGLDPDWKDKKNKKKNPYSSYEVLKGDIN